MFWLWMIFASLGPAWWLNTDNLNVSLMFCVSYGIGWLI